MFYIIVVKSYNSQLEMPVLQNCLNFAIRHVCPTQLPLGPLQKK